MAILNVNHLIINYFLVLGILQFVPSISVPSRTSISLYNSNDKLAILTRQNFSSTVYQSKTAWLVEFYASWCGHCQAYVKTYREIGLDTWGWRNVIRIAAINCYSDDNSVICDEHNVRAYPTLRLIEPDTVQNGSKTIVIPASDAAGVEKEVITQLDALHRTDDFWPKFSPISFATFDDVFTQIPSTIKLVLVIVEQRDDFTGRQIMLDFSKYYTQMVIFRTTQNATLWQQAQIKIYETPAIFTVFSNRTFDRIQIPKSDRQNIGIRNSINQAIRTYVREKRLIENFSDDEMESMTLGKEALINAEMKKNAYAQKQEKSDDRTDKAKNNQLTMVDLETALSYMLRREIPRMKEIQGETYDALVNWITVLHKYFPGRDPVMAYLKKLLSKLKEQQNGLTGHQFRSMAETNLFNAYLPENNVEYKFCAGSLPKYRGYPCALWLLFHTLTVAQTQSGNEIQTITEIPMAIKGYIKIFFGCRHCSDNFMKETIDIHLLDPKDQNAAMIYLWTIHNSVNKRLHQDITEDPEYPKIQFPPVHLCEKCHLTNSNIDDKFNMSLIIEFLQRFYAKENIDYSSVYNYTFTDDEQHESVSRKEHHSPITQYVFVELNNPYYSKSLYHRLLPESLSGFSLYLFIVILVIAMCTRKKYCRSKVARYTL